MSIAKSVQHAMMRSTRYAPLRWIYAAGYGAVLLWLMVRLRRIPGIQSLELRTPRKDHCFGSSDLDLRAQTAPLSAAEYFSLADRLADVLLPTRLWLKILDFYIFAPREMELQRILESMSFDREPRWIRLIGPKAIVNGAPREPEQAGLCRAMYEYGSLSQELFEGALDIHSTRLVFRRFTRIDNELRSGAHAVALGSEQDRVKALNIAETATLNGRMREVQLSDLEHIYALALRECDSLSEPRAARVEVESGFDFSGEAIPPDTLDDAVSSCSAAIVDLCATLSGQVQSAILGGVPTANFDYRIYLILRDGLTPEECSKVFRTIRAAYGTAGSYARIPIRYLRLRYPTVLTTQMWRASCRWYHALRPVEEYYFLKRHGVILWGDDPRDQLIAPAGPDLIRSAAIAVSDLRNLAWECVHEDRRSQFADLLLGRIPALYLLLSESRIATSSAEALRDYNSGGFPEPPILTELRQRLPGLRAAQLPATADPLWKSALLALSVWLDELGEMALARLTDIPHDNTNVTLRSAL
jgi:hypothetical protein